MYRVRTSDQHEYGPVPAEVLRKWMAEGRVTDETPVMVEGTTEWVPMSKLAALERHANPVPPVLSRLPPPLPPIRGASSSPVSPLAIVSFILGGLGLFTLGITSLPGLALGWVGLVRIKKSRGQLQGRGLAIGGICVSAVTFLILPLVLSFAIPALTQAKARSTRDQCLDNMKQLALCLRVAASQNAERLPESSRWCDAVTNQIPNPATLVCPRGGRQRCGYGMNARLSGVDVTKARGDTVMLFECKDGWNQSGGAVQMLSRHGEEYHVALLDGSVRKVPRNEASRLRWEP